MQAAGFVCMCFLHVYRCLPICGWGFSITGNAVSFSTDQWQNNSAKWKAYANLSYWLEQDTCRSLMQQWVFASLALLKPYLHLHQTLCKSGRCQFWFHLHWDSLICSKCNMSFGCSYTSDVMIRLYLFCIPYDQFYDQLYWLKYRGPVAAQELKATGSSLALDKQTFGQSAS